MGLLIALIVILFWLAHLTYLPATFQLFYFGTNLPHNARSMKGPHWWAMLSCYFFGYHFEHHQSPETPWWKLYQLKKQIR